MIIASAHFASQLSFPLSDGRVATVGPGTVHGILTVIGHTAAYLPVENPFVQVCFTFLDSSGESWAYFAFFRIDDFAPRESTVCHLTDETHPKTAARYLFAYDSRSEWVFHLADGRVMRTRMKYNELEIRLTELNDGIGVNLRFLGDYGGQVGDPGEFYRVKYALPLSLFLWQQASVVHSHDNVECAVLKHCDVRHVSGGPELARQTGLRLSPISIR